MMMLLGDINETSYTRAEADCSCEILKIRKNALILYMYENPHLAESSNAKLPLAGTDIENSFNDIASPLDNSHFHT